MTENTYPLGRIVAPDPNDHKFLMASVSPPVPLLRSVSYRRGPILTQEGPTCVGHGWKAWLSGEPIMQSKGPSPYDIYHAAQKVDEWPGEDYEGTSVRAGAKVLQGLGLIGAYVWAFEEETVRRWMLAGRGGVVIGVSWYTAMFKPNDAGFLQLDGIIEGGHCVWVRGYNHDKDAYRLQNSWGPSWGQNGHAWLRGPDLDALLRAGGECCCGIEMRAK